MSKFRKGETTHAARLARKAQSAERVAWNAYRIGDRDEVIRRLRVQHAAKRAVAIQLGRLAPTDVDFMAASLQNDMRYLRFRGDLNRYRPHQGRKELARRIRQGVNYG